MAHPVLPAQPCTQEGQGSSRTHPAAAPSTALGVVQPHGADALVGHRKGWRGRSCYWRCPNVSSSRVARHALLTTTAPGWGAGTAQCSRGCLPVAPFPPCPGCLEHGGTTLSPSLPCPSPQHVPP